MGTTTFLSAKTNGVELPMSRLSRVAAGLNKRAEREKAIGSSRSGWAYIQSHASRMDSLRLKLEKQGLVNVTYMVVNDQGAESQRLHSTLREKMSENIILHAQDPKQDDVWKALSGEKDDFLIYDRCGRLTYHIALPYSILSTPYVEEAIRETYCSGICGNCSFETSEQKATCNRTVEAEAERSPEGETQPLDGEAGTVDHHAHGHSQGHGHRHGSRERHGSRGHGHRRGQGGGGQHQHHHDDQHQHRHIHQQHSHTYIPAQSPVELGQMTFDLQLEGVPELQAHQHP
ncbi:hypothetical protein MATL_G00064070 [Megalops atlanticus]|uniref:Selenoprotein P N-terminal domain-containing protein n=1 Tax=Megalops atlanticus TaxID=7932 RepID=A0A9D3TG58_MEGAT|nr:hypothetical protein MATL_G00064070 [Megalops atlanticus]